MKEIGSGAHMFGLAALLIAISFNEFGCEMTKKVRVEREALEKCLIKEPPPYCAEALRK